MTKRTYARRTPEEKIAELQAEIAKQQAKLAAAAKADDPVLKEIPKLVKRLNKFVQTAHDAGRADLANTTSGFVAGLERMYRES